MTPSDLRAAHHSLGLSAEGAARLFRVASGRTVRGWWSGQRNGRPTDIPGPVLVLTEALMKSPEVRAHFGLSLDGEVVSQFEILPDL